MSYIFNQDCNIAHPTDLSLQPVGGKKGQKIDGPEWALERLIELGFVDEDESKGRVDAEKKAAEQSDTKQRKPAENKGG